MAGSIVHLEIRVTNLVRAQKFYGKLFGWKFRPMMPGYVIFQAGKDQVGGALDLVKKLPSKHSFCPYFEVKSIEKTLVDAKKFKVKVVSPKTEIGGGHGFMAHIKDSEGNVIGIWSMN